MNKEIVLFLAKFHVTSLSTDAHSLPFAAPEKLSLFMNRAEFFPPILWKRSTRMSRWIAFFLVCLVFGMKARGEIKVERIAYQGWQNCYHASNGEVELNR